MPCHHPSNPRPLMAVERAGYFIKIIPDPNYIFFPTRNPCQLPPILYYYDQVFTSRVTRLVKWTNFAFRHASQPKKHRFLGHKVQKFAGPAAKLLYLVWFISCELVIQWTLTITHHMPWTLGRNSAVVRRLPSIISGNVYICLHISAQPEIITSIYINSDGTSQKGSIILCSAHVTPVTKCDKSHTPF